MTVRMTKPQATLRELLAGLKKRTGLFGEQILRAENASDFYNVIGQNRNRLINGDFRIDQRNAGASVTTSALQQQIYTLDRWCYYNDVVSKRTIQQSSVAPPGFKTSVKVTVIATDTSGPQQFFRQSIEGYNIADLDWGTANAKPVTLSFWVRSSVTGQHGGAIQSTNTDQCFPFAYTINVADTWEYKTITIPGSASGTWGSTNGTGGSLQFEHGAGYQKTPPGVWVTSNTSTSTGSVNLCATNGATWYITGVQLERGTVATPFDTRDYGRELQLCQRYYTKLELTKTLVYATTTTYAQGNYRLPVTMRAAPTSIATNASVMNELFVANISGTYVPSSSCDTDSVWVIATNTGGTAFTANRQYRFNTAGCSIDFSSEL